MKFVIAPRALAELRDAAEFYSASGNARLANAFVAEFERAAAQIGKNPVVGASFRQRWRRYVLRRFPYSVIYVVASDEILVIAVAHHRRRPAYWASEPT